jgi:hypothetical protein
LDPIDENCQVSEHIAALERVSAYTNAFWIESHRRSAIVLLQDHVCHVGEAVDGCRRSLDTMFLVMLPGNPPPENFGQLLEVFKTSRHIHQLIELNLIAGANFSLGWVQKWHPRPNFATMSLGLPPAQRSRAVALQFHMDATLQPARRMIARLLKTDANFFREYHYLNPLLVDQSYQAEL